MPRIVKRGKLRPLLSFLSFVTGVVLILWPWATAGYLLYIGYKA